MKIAAITNDNEPLGLEVEIAEREGQPGVWTVEAVNVGSEGEVYQALFVGPEAKERACAYACWAYGIPSGDTKT
jgi:hypothetical protein